MNAYPKILGIFSSKQKSKVGTGTTLKKSTVTATWYVRQLGEETFEVQPLNPQHIPSGACQKMSLSEFVEAYSPEPSYYAKHTVPALETLAKKVQMGEACLDKGDLNQAEKEFLKALMLDERSVDANYGLGEVYCEKNECANLKRVLDRLMGIPEAFSSENRFKFNRLGISLRKKGRYDEAIKYYQKSLAEIDTDEHVYFNLARVYYEKHMAKDCMNNLSTALTINPEFNAAAQFLSYCKHTLVVETS